MVRLAGVQGVNESRQGVACRGLRPRGAQDLGEVPLEQRLERGKRSCGRAVDEDQAQVAIGDAEADRRVVDEVREGLGREEMRPAILVQPTVAA